MSAEHRIPLGLRPHLVRCRRVRAGRGPSRFLLEAWWSLLLFEYHADLLLDGRSYRIAPGNVILVPPGVEKQYRCPERACWHRFVHFRLQASDDHVHRMAEFLPSVAHPERLAAEIDQVIDAARQGDPLRAEVHLWHGLLGLCAAEGRRDEQADLHPAALRARELLEQDLRDPPSLAGLAARVGVSANHLNTLFKRHFAETVHACLTHLRMDQAGYLLRHSGHPIREIAAIVGMPDLQAFNKAVKRHLGGSPRGIRGR